ncbi:dienelactone hydrolase family protein [Asticcacaulis tiandongensis]|uniref:dienelactone hydrolase family protein n=1 Tax=Asticcacaulis tiandongensis TaxID=2565365 RepID=UPI00112D73D3|nr:dienelactone hydrolase family protein [Asticcacaulis tiandongensis]
MTQITDTRFNITSADGQIDAEAFHPEGNGPFPAVILFTDIRGSRPVYSRLAQKISALGLYVLVPHVYYRAGPAPVIDPALPVQDESVRAQRQALRAALTPETLSRDFAALTDFLRSRREAEANNIGVVGYCMSGAFALRLAAEYPDRVRAAASFHGGGLATDAPDSPHLLAPRLKARLYFGHADHDASIPAESIARLEDALQQAGADFESHVYDARHGFAIEDAAAFDRAAYERHFGALTTLFGSTLLAS